MVFYLCEFQLIVPFKVNAKSPSAVERVNRHRSIFTDMITNHATPIAESESRSSIGHGVAGCLLLPQLADGGGGQQCPRVAHRPAAMRRPRGALHAGRPVRKRRRRGRRPDRDLPRRQRRRRRQGCMDSRRRRHLPLQPPLLQGEALRIYTSIVRGEPYDSRAYVSWVLRGACPAIPQVLGVYRKLMERGFQVFLVTGRSEDVLGASTVENLAAQGFDGHHRLIMRSAAYRGYGAVPYKSTIRRQLVAEGYRIRGNVGDQWSDLLGECVGDRTFKIPNPMYFIP
ncbi:uncharacterized protein LOC121994512 isoform X1 [Zingiber officinale]|uniref:uncharacterized protein LOC121994512 isoform X1 n=1 Tax=Zingiber officinale TaxID=94328 RepID=UPI001C4D531C|nr:uncharacterized protein LOC121994512 isoform X1 [Zingiber officinale]